MSWGPGGDRLAYFARTGRGKRIVIQNVVTKDVLKKYELDVDEPESPASRRTARPSRSRACATRRRHLRPRPRQREVTNLTQDQFYNYAPIFSPDGRSIVYIARVSGNEKLFRFDLAAKKSTQITFGTHDDTAARFLDADTIVFASTAIDPAQTVDPEVARNGNIYNLWTLNTTSGELKQYTDSLGGNVNPIVLKDAKGTRVAFISYYKGKYGLHTMELTKPLKAAATADFGAPGPVIDFQAPLTHTLVAQNVRKKKSWEKLFLEGRPSVAVGVTNNADFFGGTAIAFSDVLGDRRVNLTIGAIMQYTTFAGSYMDISKRFQWAVQGIYQKQFFYGNNPYYYDPLLNPVVSRDMAEATRMIAGGSAFGIYPLDAYRRVEVTAGFYHQSDSYNEDILSQAAELYPGQGTLNYSGELMPFGVSFVQETTVFREFGPLAGNTMRLGYEIAPKIGSLLSRQTIDTDVRYYQRLLGTGTLAFRFRGFKSIGDYPDYLYFGGMSEMRGYDYLEFVGQNAVFGNVELRFPIIEAMLTPIGVLGGIRGVLFFDMGAGWFNDTNFKWWTDETQTFQQQIGVTADEDGNLVGIYADPVTVSGFRLVDSRASYGIGLETFVLGFPMHFDWSWRTMFNKSWEDAYFGPVYAEEWRRPKFSFWIGYDW